MEIYLVDICPGGNMSLWKYVQWKYIGWNLTRGNFTQYKSIRVLWGMGSLALLIVILAWSTSRQYYFFLLHYLILRCAEFIWSYFAGVLLYVIYGTGFGFVYICDIIFSIWLTYSYTFIGVCKIRQSDVCVFRTLWHAILESLRRVNPFFFNLRMGPPWGHNGG